MDRRVSFFRTTCTWPGIRSSGLRAATASVAATPKPTGTRIHQVPPGGVMPRRKWGLSPPMTVGSTPPTLATTSRLVGSVTGTESTANGSAGGTGPNPYLVGCLAIIAAAISLGT